MKQKDRSRNWLGICSAAAASALAGVGIAAVSVVLSPSIVQAQVPFQIIRPDNGATVRETVRIIMSRRALDDAEVKYLSFSIDGKFCEAVAVLPLNGQKDVHSDLLEVTPTTVALLWNTKLPSADTNTANGDVSSSLGREDGSHTIEIIAQSADGHRLGSKTLTLNVQNRGGLQVPADGLQMDYHFQVGDTSNYRETTVVDFEGDQLNQNPANESLGGEGYVSRGHGGGGGMSPGGFPGAPGGGQGGQGGFGPGEGGGGRGFGGPGGGYSPVAGASGEFTVLVQNVLADYERSTEDNLGDGLFFIRDKVDGGTIIGGNGSAARLEDVYTFKSRYRTIFTSGRVKEFGLANAAHPGAYVAMPIPNIGGGRRRVGQTWKTLTPIKLEWATLDKPPIVSADNTLEGLEWQDGYQTARIKQTFNGKADIPIYGGAGMMQGASVKMERTIWFAYRAGKIIRTQTDMTVSGEAPAPILSSMVPSAGVNASIGGGIGGPGGGGMMPGFAGAGGPPVAGGPGNMGGGFGALQQGDQPVVRVPAKFHSTSTVQLVLPGKP